MPKYKDDLIKEMAEAIASVNYGKHYVIGDGKSALDLAMAQAAYRVVEEIIGKETISMKLGHPDDLSTKGAGK